MNPPTQPLAANPALTPVLLVVLASLSAFSPLSIDMYLPALPTIAADLRASAGDIQLTLSIFMVAFGVGQIFYGPAGDRFGRRPVILCSISIYVLTSVGCAFATGSSQLIGASCRGWRRAVVWCWRAPWCAISPNETRRRAPCR